MELGGVSEEDLGRAPRVRAESDPTSLRLSPAEGYLLSRIDGHTSWRLLREIGGMTPEEVDICLEGWLGDGVIEMGEYEHKSRVPESASPPGVPGVIDESRIDDRLEIDVEIQRRILDMESRLGCGYAEILGVDSDAETKVIKKAYRKLSREFHPDRYFRKQIGDYKVRLEAIFKKILEAYELLSDPATRAEVQKAMAASAEPGTVGAPHDTGTRVGVPQKPLTRIELLRLRMPFKVPESVLSERRARARSLHESAQSFLHQGRMLEAASSVRLAIAFDPHEDAYKQTFGEIQGSIAEERVKSLLSESGHWTRESELRDGLKLCEEALLYRPHDPELNHTAARVALGARQLEAAREYAERSIEHSPDVGRYHRMMAEVLQAAGDEGHARREAEIAVEIDPGDVDSKKLLDKLRVGSRRAVRGGG